MRKVLAFGAVPGFAGEYAAFFSRRGFELDECTSPAGPLPLEGGRPVLLVFGASVTPRDESLLASFLDQDGKLPVILVSREKAALSDYLKKITGKARYTLPEKFLKKDLVTSLKGTAELLALTEKVAELESEFIQKTKELSCVMEVTKVLSSSLDPSKVMARILEHTRSVAGAQSWVLFIVDGDTGGLMFNSAKGRPASKECPLRLGPGEGISGWAAEDRSPKVVRDVSLEPRFSGEVDRTTGLTTESVMAVPIICEGKLLGVVELVNKQTPGGFTRKDVELVSLLMDQTALAIERTELYQRMEDLVITDDLTKLFNLRYLDRTLEVEIERATRYNLSVSLIFMDVDHFKDVNDRYGHLIGSKLLVEISQILLKGLRKIDIVARYGGDEFVIVLPQTDVKSARFIAERIRRAIEKKVFLESENLSLNLTASFGIASFPDHASSQEELLQLADEAMYRVKYQTRNDVYVAGNK
ncbi:MAG TPA: sensor domain-containing diguanylate cyclase [Nitrospirota bacterium]